MVFLFESELPENKSIFFALTQIYGLGRVKSTEICKKLGLSKNCKIKNLSKEQLQNLISLIEMSKLLLTGELKKMNLLRKKNLLSIRSYRGIRLKQGLPVRGQRTHTNARSARKRK